MSFTPGQLFGAVIGAAVAVIFPPAAGLTFAYLSTAVSIGMFVGGVIDPPDGRVIKQEGGRLSDLSTQTAEWGTPIRRLFGTYKMSGNVIWSLDLHETKHVEESGEGKGGGGTQTETTWYSYAGSWAVAFCEGPVDGIKRIWFDSVLVYDNNNYSGGLTYSNNYVHFGTSDQSIDWYIQSINPDTPAYRNVFYIVFNSIQLENYGNRIPNVSVEVVKDGEQIPITLESSTSMGSTCDTRYSWCLNPSPNSNAIIHNTITTSWRLIYPNVIAYEDNITKQVWKDNYTISFDDRIQAINYRKYYASLGVYAYYDGVNYWSANVPSDRVVSESITKLFFMNNLLYAMYKQSPSSTYTYLVENHIIDINNVPTSTTPIIILEQPLSHIIQYSLGYALLGYDNSITLLDEDFLEIKSFIVYPTTPFSHDTGNGMTNLIGVIDNKLYIAGKHSTNNGWAFYKVDLVEETMNLIGEIGSTSSNSHIWDIGSLNTFSMNENHIYNANIQYYNAGPSWNIFRLGGINDNQVTVSSIVNELLLRAGLEQNDFDTSEGTDLVNGYVLPNPMDTRSAIATLISAYKFDLVESDSKLILKKRGSLIVDAIIPEEDVVDFLEINRIQTVELSRAINILYSNKDNNYDIGSQSALRPDSDSESTKSYQYPLALSDDEAKQLAEMYLYSEWNERLEFMFSLPSEYIYLNPSDILNIENEGKVFNVRITKIDYVTNRQINVKASLENPIIYGSSAIGSDTGVVDELVKLVGPTNFELLDIPMLDNAYDKEGIYIAANGYLGDWSGCGIDRSIDAELSYSTVGTIISGTIIGYSASTLSSGPTTIWDDNSVTVSIVNGDLYSLTIEQVLSANNYILIGEEVLQYSDATDNGDGTFLLETLLRGRRGTEWAIDTHSIGERVVTLSSNMMFDLNASLNVDTYYKATTFGHFIEDSTAKQITPEIVCLKPLSVSYLNGMRDTSNNLTITWSRRSRDVTGYFKTLQLFEETESYEIYIVDADITYQSSTESYIYNNSQQLIDIPGHVSGDQVSVIIYQISGIIGRGYGTEGVV